MSKKPTAEASPRMVAAARRFGELIKARRAALVMRQEDLALATGVGRRFIIELEAGKTTCYLGHALVIAEALGVSFSAVAKGIPPSQIGAPDLPEVEG